jgi:hypothetical protein
MDHPIVESIGSSPSVTDQDVTDQVFYVYVFYPPTCEIPIRRRIGEELILPSQVAHRFLIDFDAQARPRRNADVTLTTRSPLSVRSLVPG